jgi:LysM repeat protein
MSTPNPLVPEGSLQQPKGKSNVKIVFFSILAVHAFVLGGLLMQGCKDKPKAAAIETPELQVSTNDAAVTPSIPEPNVETVASPSNTTPIGVPNLTAQPPGGAAPVTSPVAPITPPTVDPATLTAKEHVIAAGDTLGKVAKDNHISLKTLLEANPNINPTKLKVGQKIQIPSPSFATAGAEAGTVADPGVQAENVYVVKPGDMLERIAKTHGTSVKAIKTANNLKTDRLKVGQKLKLPAAKVTATAQVAPVAPENPLAATALTSSKSVATNAK